MRLLGFLLVLLISSALNAQNWLADYSNIMTKHNEGEFAVVSELGVDLLEELSKDVKKSDTAYLNTLSILAYANFQLQNYSLAISYAKSEKLHRTEEDPAFQGCVYYLAIYNSYGGDYSNAGYYLDTLIKHLEKDTDLSQLGTFYLSSLRQQADMHSAAGNISSAETAYEKLYQIVESRFEPLDSMVIAAGNALSMFYFANGKFDKAEPFYTGAAELMSKQFGELSEYHFFALNSLGQFYLSAAMPEKAVGLFKKQVKLYGKFYGIPSADYATAKNNLAVAYNDNGDYEKAEELYLETLALKEDLFKKESNFYAVTLYNLGVFYETNGKYDDAEKNLREAISIYEGLESPEMYDYAFALSALSSVLTSTIKYGEATEFIDKSIRVHEGAYGKTSVGYINALEIKANMFTSIGKLSAADSIYHTSSELRIASQGATHRDYATLLYKWAHVKEMLHDYTKSEELLSRARQIHENNGDKKTMGYARVLMGIGGVLSKTNRLYEAKRIYKQCFRLFKSGIGETHPDFAVLLQHAGYLYMELGDYSKAEQYLIQSLELSSLLYGENQISSVNVHDDLGRLYTSKGEYFKAEKHLKQALKIVNENFPENDPTTGYVLLNIGKIYMDLGNYTQAELSFERALKSIGASYGMDNVTYAEALSASAALHNSMALDQTCDLELMQSHLDKSIDLFEKSLEIKRKYATDNTNLALDYHNLGTLRRNNGKVSKGLELQKKALELSLKYSGKNNSTTANIFLETGLCYAESGLADLAQKNALEALTIQEDLWGEHHLSLMNTLYSLSSIMGSQQKQDEANTYALRAKGIFARYVQENFKFMSEREKSNFLTAQEGMMQSFRTTIFSSANKTPSLNSELMNLEIAFSGLLLESSDRIKQTIENSNDTGLVTLYDRWKDDRKMLANLYSTPISERGTKTADLEKEINDLEKELVIKVEGWDKIISTSPKWEYLKTQLSSKEAFVQFGEIPYLENGKPCGHAYFALIGTSESDHPYMQYLFNEEDLTTHIGQYTNNTFSGINKVYGSKEAPDTTLYHLIWKSLEHTLSGKTEIYYVPSAGLHKISFAAMAINDSIWLSDRYNLHLLGSGAQLAEKQDLKKPESFDNFFLFGGAQFSLTEADEEVWTYLKGTKTEVESIHTMLGKRKLGGRIFTGAQASEENLKEQVRKNSPEVLHVASHGFFYPDPKEVMNAAQTTEEDIVFRGSTVVSNYVMNKNPMMRSGLVFAGANMSSDSLKSHIEDGILTAYEVSLLDLQNTELVVLSACETGLGDVKGSEGVYGLQRAFKIAGAKHLIMSLWQVPDKETKEFMEQFYTSYLAQGDIKTALISAQNRMKQKYSPYYWGAFVLMN